MAASITVRPEGLPRIEAMLAALMSRTDDLSPLMERIGMAMEATTIERFDNEEAPDGSSWVQSIRAKETGGKTLTDSARLKQSITYRAGADQVEVGTNVIYAGAHQKGATIRATSGGRLAFKLPGGLGFRTAEEVILPARPFLGISADDELEIAGLAEDYLLELGA